MPNEDGGNVNNANAANQNNSANGIKAPKSMRFDSKNMDIIYKEWIQQFNWFAVATQLSKKPGEVQAATLMATIGTEAAVVFNTFKLTDAEQVDIQVIKQKFSDYFNPKSNTTYERYVFNILKQEMDETFDEFLTKARTQLLKCDYGDLADSLLKDKIVIGVLCEEIRKKLLAETELTLEKAINLCRANERASKHFGEMQTREQNTVESVRTTKSNSKVKSNSSKEISDDEQFDCKRCGTEHSRKSCPAYKKKCDNCNIPGHFARMCKSKTSKPKKIHQVDNYSESSEDNSSDGEEIIIREIKTKGFFELYVDDIEDGDHDDSWYEVVEIAARKIKLKLDSGAQCNVLSQKYLKRSNVKIRPSKVKRLVSFSHHKMKVIGEAIVELVIKNRKRRVLFVIVNEDVTPILGKKSCEELKLIVKLDEIESCESDDVFNGIGCLKKFVYDIDLVENPKFTIEPARRIPYAYREKVKEELDSMERNLVIKRITEPTPVVSPLVIVHKKNKLRICIDLTQVNKNIRRRHYPLKTMEEIATRTKGSKYFTLLDCRRGFWQIKVTERTQKYLVFSTPWGRYSFQRLPFGLASAPEVFSEILNSLLKNVENVEISMDDILIHSDTEEGLKDRTNQVVNVLRKAGLTLNKEKCVFRSQRIKFLGHIFTPDGIKPDDEKIEAIKKIEIPKNKKQLQRFLGMITYLSKFIKNMSDITDPLRKLLHNDVEWEWSYEQQASFELLKEKLSSAPVLRYYDVNADVTLSVDASSKAIGAVLLQNGQPVGYASMALSPAQLNYPQIEKEATAIKFGCKKFHQYIYGKRLKVESDHKPLEIIFKKPLNTAPPRLQRIIFDVMQYSPIVEYKKGKELFLADALSRDCATERDLKMERELEMKVHICLALKHDAGKRLVRSTSEDPELVKLKKMILDGWPEEIRLVESELRKYWNFREELSSYEGLIYKGDRFFIPKNEQQNIMTQIHCGHLGIGSSISRAKRIVYWFGMTKDLTEFVSRCSICQKTQRKPAREPLILKAIPSLPWEICGSDLFKYHGVDYLILCDSYSGYFELEAMENGTSSRQTIEILKKWFAIHGIPRILETNGGPQYISKEFQNFEKSWNFNRQPSSPYYPRSNGLAERYVEIAKNLLRKCIMDGTDIQLALLNWRNVPRNDDLKSPVERLMSRTTRTVLPIKNSLLQPKIVQNVTSNISNLRQIQKYYADRGVREGPSFQKNDNVRLRVGHRDWVGAKIAGKTDKPRSYILERQDGKLLRRNTSQIRLSSANLKSEIPIVVDPTENFVPTETVSPTTTPDTTIIQPVPCPEPLPQTSHLSRIVTRSGRQVKPVVRLNL